MIQVFCDGSITGSHWAKADNQDSLPHAWAGWWARDQGGNVLKWKSVDIGEAPHMSANVAEYFAVRSALNWVQKSLWNKQDVHVFSDSQTVIRQLTHRYNCYEPKLIVLRDHCLQIAERLGYVTYTWIRREENRTADVLSKALQIWGRQPTWDEIQERLKGPRKGRPPSWQGPK